MDWRASELETLFAACFEDNYQTVLQGGREEPLYLPSSDPASSPHRVVYRADYFASALHELAHWCLAGAERREQEDYGYWYSPDGRSAEQQEAFERAEARPQALESLFSEACGFEFHLSADNLDGGVGRAGASRAPSRRRGKSSLMADCRLGQPNFTPRYRMPFLRPSRSLSRSLSTVPESVPGWFWLESARRVSNLSMKFQIRTRFSFSMPSVSCAIRMDSFQAPSM